MHQAFGSDLGRFSAYFRHETAFVVAGLMKRRAELAGDIEAAHEALRRMVQDLENLDATILQFDPAFQIEAIRPKAFRPPKDWANRGEMIRIVLSILRQASEPLTARDIAYQLLTERALNRRINAFCALCGAEWRRRYAFSGTKASSIQIRGLASTCFGRSAVSFV